MEFANKFTSSFTRRNQAKLKWNDSETAKASATRDPNSYTIKFDKGALLLAAVSCGDTDETIRLIRDGANVNYANIDGLTSLHQACIDEDLQMVKLLVDNGAFIDSSDNEGWTPLHAAASGSSIEINRYLINKGATITAVNSEGELPSDLAEHPEIEKYFETELKKRDIDPDQAREKEHKLMLNDAMKWKYMGFIEDIKDPQGACPLHVAASKGYIDVLQILLDLGSNPNAVDNDGWTSLHAAVYWKNLDVCEYLLCYGADINFKNNAGDIPIKLADEHMTQCLQKIIAEYRVNQKLSLSIKRNENESIDKNQFKKNDAITKIKSDKPLKGILRLPRCSDSSLAENKSVISAESSKILDQKQNIKLIRPSYIMKPSDTSNPQQFTQKPIRPPVINHPPIKLTSEQSQLDTIKPSSSVLDKMKPTNHTALTQTANLLHNISKGDSEHSSSAEKKLVIDENNLAPLPNLLSATSDQASNRSENLLRFRLNFPRHSSKVLVSNPSNSSNLLDLLNKHSSSISDPSPRSQVTFTTNSSNNMHDNSSFVTKRLLPDNSDTQSKLTDALAQISILENEVWSLKMERDNLLKKIKELQKQLSDGNLSTVGGKYKPNFPIARPPTG